MHHTANISIYWISEINFGKLGRVPGDFELLIVRSEITKSYQWIRSYIRRPICIESPIVHSTYHSTSHSYHRITFSNQYRMVHDNKWMDRDLTGYGPDRPDAKWPKGAKIAVNCESDTFGYMIAN